MTVQNSENGTEVEQSGTETVRRVGRSHVDYWAPRLKKRQYEWEGKTVEIPEWQIRIAHLGRREWFNTSTANKSAAAEKARKIYLSLISKGWEPTLQEFKPDMQIPKDGCTVGEFLDQVKAASGLKPVTYEIYAKKFRSLVSGVFRIHGDKEKFDYVNGGRQRWLDRIRAVRLDRLTPESINAWRVNYLKSASANPLQHKHALITANSVLRAGKSLFSPKVTKLLSINLPKPLPFDGVENPKVPKTRYQSEIDPAHLLQQARRELGEFKGDSAEEKREMFKIILLALGAGLRRDEIDTLQCRNILWQRHVIRVQITEHGGTKSAESEADVDVDPGLLTLLKKFLPDPAFGSTFVIHSNVQPKPKAASYHHYRCDRLFRHTIEWLRGKGITARNALHSLRKEFGSQICAQGGIYAASLALRHASIQITCDYYTDKKKAVVFPMGNMLRRKTLEVLPAAPAAGKVA